MSILQEYGDIRRQLGEEEWNMIDKFLSENNQYQLSDVLYKEKVWKIYEDWKRGSSDMKINRKNVKSNRKINRRPVKAAESYGWEVDSSEAWEAYEFACDYFGKENLDDQIVSGLSTDELAESLVYIFRMNDFREWDERNGGSDEDEDEEILYELDDAGKGFTNEDDYIEYASEHITELSDDDLYSVWKEAKDTAERWAKSEYESLQELAKKFQELFELANAEDERRSDAEDIEESRKLRGKRAIKSSKRNTRRPVMAMRLTRDFSEFRPWSGAVDTWNTLADYDKLDVLESILDTTFIDENGEGIMSETELNDLLWFEPETVYEWVGLYYNDETGEISDEPFDEEDEDEDEDIEESTKVRGKQSVTAAYGGWGKFYGLDDVEFTVPNDTDDPTIFYNDNYYNYYDIEDTLWSYYKEEREETGGIPDEDEFESWVMDNSYLVYDLLDNATPKEKPGRGVYRR